MATRTLARFLLAPMMAVALAACGDDGGDGGNGADASTDADVNATVADFSITLDPGSVAAGEVTFSIANDGLSTHEFVVFKTDLAPDALPVDGGVVPEDDPSLTNAGEAEDIGSGSEVSLALTLDAGSYVVICNVPSHYEAGMRTALTVA
ncbi:MAG TPA: plastocyanin/azurin family copper-binding protein [Actinomycetota bacterium]|nr:plastocyanin/azurin family copper-binding protein [Actinomycetota bacterium]